LDRIRYFCEECDRLQGFQSFISIDSGFAGLSSDILQSLKEEFPKASLFNFAIDISTPIEQEDLNRKIINSAMSLNSITPLGSIYVPMAPSLWMRDAFPHQTV
jgi:hypothetical protein